MTSEAIPLMGGSSQSYLSCLGVGLQKTVRKVDDCASKAVIALSIIAGVGFLLVGPFVYLLSERTVTLSKEFALFGCLGLGVLYFYGGVTQVRLARTLCIKRQQELETNRRLSVHQSQQARHMAQARAYLMSAGGCDREALDALVAQALTSNEESGDTAVDDGSTHDGTVPRSGYLAALTAHALASASGQQATSASGPMNVSGNDAGDDAAPTSAHLAALLEEALATCEEESGSVSDPDRLSNDGSATPHASPPITADLNDLILQATQQICTTES